MLPLLTAGDLLAVPWEDDDGWPDGWRILEVVETTEDAVRFWAFRWDHAGRPVAVDPSALTRIRLHEHLGGVMEVPMAELATWQARPVRRA